jgi:hypothetical protein
LSCNCCHRLLFIVCFFTLILFVAFAHIIRRAEATSFYKTHRTAAYGVVRRLILCAGVAIYQRVEAYDTLFATIGDNLYLFAVARLEAYGCGGGDVKVAPECRRTVKLKIAINLEEMEVRAYLYGSVASVANGNLVCRARGVVLYIPIA